MIRVRKSSVTVWNGTQAADAKQKRLSKEAKECTVHPQYELALTADELSVKQLRQSETDRSTISRLEIERLWFGIYLPDLPLEACGGGRESLAVVEERQGIHRVLLADASARAAGISPGQSSNAALALLPTLQLEERCPIRERRLLVTLAARLERYTSFVTMSDTNVLLLEIAGSLRLFGGLQNLRRQISRELERQGVEASLAIAATPLAATWLARSRRRVCVRESGNITRALRDLSLECVDWPEETLESLSGMGVTTIGACLRLPREGFARRFGTGCLLELDRALGRLPDPRSSWRAPERFCKEYEMSEEQDDREYLLAICHELLLVHERFLLKRQIGVQQVGFSFFHLKSKATQLALGCKEANRSASHWLELLRLRFDRLSLPEAVIAIRLSSGEGQATPIEPEELTLNGRMSRTSRHAMMQLAERLAARMGDQSVHGVTLLAEHRPQFAWRANRLMALAFGNDDFPARSGMSRPLWMLPEPALLQIERDRPWYEGCLALVEGPERLETGWWDGEGITRDYYSAVNPQGKRMWVFRERNRELEPQASWYLQGIFG